MLVDRARDEATVSLTLQGHSCQGPIPPSTWHITFSEPIMVPSANPSPPVWVFALLPVFLVIMWLFVGAVLAWVSGWSELADRFPGGPRPNGEKMRRQVLRLGRVRENGLTTLIATNGGLYMYANPLFRFRRPPVLIPWRNLRHVESGRLLWAKWHVLELADVTRMYVRDSALPTLRAHGVSIRAGD